LSRGRMEDREAVRAGGQELWWKAGELIAAPAQEAGLQACRKEVLIESCREGDNRYCA
jgi:hypothetical protein